MMKWQKDSTGATLSAWITILADDAITLTISDVDEIYYAGAVVTAHDATTTTEKVWTMS